MVVGVDHRHALAERAAAVAQPFGPVEVAGHDLVVVGVGDASTGSVWRQLIQA